MRKQAFRVEVEGRWTRQPGNWVAIEGPAGFWLGFLERGGEGVNPIDSVPVGETFVLDDEFDVVAFDETEAEEQGVEAWWEIWGWLDEIDTGERIEFDDAVAVKVTELTVLKESGSSE